MSPPSHHQATLYHTTERGKLVQGDSDIGQLMLVFDTSQVFNLPGDEPVRGFTQDEIRGILLDTSRVTPGSIGAIQHLRLADNLERWTTACLQAGLLEAAV
jgi:hypothetical protein